MIRMAVGILTALAACGYAVSADVVRNKDNNSTAYASDSLPRRMGSWPFEIMGAFDGLPEDQLVTNKYYDTLRHTETWFNLFLFTDSGEFRHLSNVAATPSEGAALVGGTWIKPLKFDPKAGAMVPDTRPQPWTGQAAQELTPDRKNRYTIKNQATREIITFDNHTIEWVAENGDIRLKGTEANPAVGYMLHWRDPKQGTDLLWYMNQHFKVEGMYYGEHVTGYAVPEHMWGHRNYHDTWWVQNREGIWGFWETEYEDHTFEKGMLMCGNGGSRAALIENSRGIVLNTVEFNVSMAPDGKKVEFTFSNGPKWEFERTMNYFIPSAATHGTTLANGYFKRVGETRKVIRTSQGVLAFFRGKLCEPIRIGQAVQ